jgi:hypothetical protein
VSMQLKCRPESLCPEQRQRAALIGMMSVFEIPNPSS